MAKKHKRANQRRKQQRTTRELPFEALERALAWIVNEGIFSELPLHGNTTWTPGQLVVLAVLWVWSDKSTLTGAFQHAKHLALSMLGQVALTTYQGLTLLWHMGLRMPWTWKTGPSTSSERGHFLEMLTSEVFPENTLFCGDAGFVGYDLWKTIQDAGHHFVIRVGANVRLLKNLGHAREHQGLVYLWPAEAARKKQPPLVLRLIVLRGPRGPVYLVTNVLSTKALSDRQAAKIYRLRWGVELQFRSYKQTFGRSKLRSRTPERALVELDWSLLGLWMIQLFAVKEQMAMGSPPERSSVALAVSVIQEVMYTWPDEVCNPRMLRLRLSAAVKDDYHRTTSKRARYRPHYKDVPSTGKPKLKQATAQQRKAYQAVITAA